MASPASSPAPRPHHNILPSCSCVVRHGLVHDEKGGSRDFVARLPPSKQHILPRPASRKQPRPPASRSLTPVEVAVAVAVSRLLSRPCRPAWSNAPNKPNGSRLLVQIPKTQRQLNTGTVRHHCRCNFSAIRPMHPSPTAGLLLTTAAIPAHEKQPEVCKAGSEWQRRVRRHGTHFDARGLH